MYQVIRIDTIEQTDEYNEECVSKWNAETQTDALRLYRDAMTYCFNDKSDVRLIEDGKVILTNYCENGEWAR